MTLDQAIVRIDSIAKENGVLAKENAALAARVRLLEEHIRLSRLKQFGPSSEKSDGGQRVLDVFDEAEASADPAEPEPTVESITHTRRKQKGHRRQLFDDLPVERIDIELPEGERNCSECQGPLDDIGVEISQKLKIVPAQYSVEETARHKYVCPHCQNEGTTRIVAAPAPELAFPKSMATPSVVAHVMNQKFVSGVPLYRQEQELARIDLSISRQTMANWMIAGAVWLEAIYDQMKRHLLSGDIVHADETTLQVLCEPGREAQTTSYMWLYRSGAYRPPGGPGPIVLYEYQRTRAREHPLKFLQGYKGYLHTDGYEAYNTLPDVIGVGCWAHARRYFHEALEALPKDQRAAAFKPGNTALAATGLNYCNKLFAIEKTLKDASPPQRHAARLVQSAPLLEQMLIWLDKAPLTALPKGATGKAITYSRNQWTRLTAFLLDGRLDIDNNISERAIRPFVIGRKNWLFANTPNGAKASATIYSIIETAKENGLHPFGYLVYLFEQLPNMTTSQLDALMPWAASVPDRCRSKALHAKR